ncbi:MAG: hypothetical protein R6W82_05390 [bacterium]
MRTGVRRRLVMGLAAAACLWSVEAHAQFQVQIIPTGDIEAFYLSDLDPLQTGNASDFFLVRLMNNTGAEAIVSLEFELSSDDYGMLATGRTEPFALGQMAEFGNTDLTTLGQQYSLQDYDIDTESAEELGERILESGVLPSDTYHFTLVLYQGGMEVARNTWDRPVINPSRVDLLAPGGEFGGVLPVVANDTPQFFWATDAFSAGTSVRFRIRVVRVDDAATAEEAMQGYASWEEEIANSTSAIYPPGVSALPLEPGATYAWQVERLVETSGGTRELESEIFWFKMEDTSAGILGADIQEEVRDMMDQILGTQGMGSEMEGFRPTGTVLIDGRPVEINALRELLQQIVTGQITVTIQIR